MTSRTFTIRIKVRRKYRAATRAARPHYGSNHSGCAWTEHVLLLGFGLVLGGRSLLARVFRSSESRSRYPFCLYFRSIKTSSGSKRSPTIGNLFGAFGTNVIQGTEWGGIDRACCGASVASLAHNSAETLEAANPAAGTACGSPKLRGQRLRRQGIRCARRLPSWPASRYASNRPQEKIIDADATGRDASGPHPARVRMSRSLP